MQCKKCLADTQQFSEIQKNVDFTGRSAYG